MKRQAHPFSICSQIALTRIARWESDVGRGERLCGAVLQAAFGGQAAAFVAIEVELDDCYRRSGDCGGAGHGEVVLKRLAERPELLCVAIGIDRDLLDQDLQSAPFGPGGGLGRHSPLHDAGLP